MISWRKDYRPGCMQFGVLIVFGVIATVATLISLVAGRHANNPTYNVISGKPLMIDTFEQSSGDWRTFNIENAAAFDWDMQRQLLAGRVTAGRGHLVTTTRTRTFRNIMLEATIKSETIPTNTTLSAGVVCHADAEANGYYFLVASTGRVSIQKGLADEPDLIPLIPWTANNTVQPDINRLRAVCAYNYLALYVNDVFVADVRDTTFSDGLVGLTIAGGFTNNATSRTASQVEMFFDDVIVTGVTQLAIR